MSRAGLAPVMALAQRCGLISDDGNTTTGAWEGSADGQEWKHDFDLTYFKVRSS